MQNKIFEIWPYGCDKSHDTTDSWYYLKNDIKKVQGKTIFVTSCINYKNSHINIQNYYQKKNQRLLRKITNI